MDIGKKTIWEETLSVSNKPIDFYKQARDMFLKTKLENYPDVVFETLFLSFSISNNTKKAPLIYAILERIKQATIDKNNISITINSEREVLLNFQYITDLLNVIGNWRSTLLQVNGVTFGRPTEFGYLKDFIHEKNIDFLGSDFKNIQYLSAKKRTRKQQLIKTGVLSRDNPHTALEAIIEKYVEIHGMNKDVRYYCVSANDKLEGL